MFRHVTLATLALAALLTACGGGSDADSPEAAIEHIFELVNKGQWGPEWDLLHPAHQTIIPRDLFIECSQKLSGSRDFKAKAVDSYEEEIGIPGTNLRAPSTAVTFELQSFSLGGAKTTRTMHLIDVDGTWRWLVNDVEPFKKGECPA